MPSRCVAIIVSGNHACAVVAPGKADPPANEQEAAERAREGVEWLRAASALRVRKP